MKLINTSLIEIKKSKFYGYYYEINSIDEAKEVIEQLKKEHKKARHIPYAYKVNNTAKKTDDKEPSNTAGLPIYNIIERKQLDNCLVAVVRYFISSISVNPPCGVSLNRFHEVSSAPPYLLPLVLLLSELLPVLFPSFFLL